MQRIAPLLEPCSTGGFDYTLRSGEGISWRHYREDVIRFVAEVHIRSEEVDSVVPGSGLRGLAVSESAH